MLSMGKDTVRVDDISRQACGQEGLRDYPEFRAVKDPHSNEGKRVGRQVCSRDSRVATSAASVTRAPTVKYSPTWANP